MKNLSFQDLRGANNMRNDMSYNQCGEWTETDWAVAIAGECGEMCNLIKKRKRGDEISIEEVGKEIADQIIYLDLLASSLGLNTGEIVTNKFNEVSKRINSPVTLPAL